MSDAGWPIRKGPVSTVEPSAAMIYEAESVPLITYYASTDELETVDASQDELAVQKDLLRRIALRTANGT